MKKKQKLLVALMALTLAGGVTSALALTRNATTGTSSSAQFDQAIYLYWDAESTTSAGMSDIESIQVNTPVYRYLTVSPKSTKSVSGTVTLTFTLAAAQDKVATGLTIDVYPTASLGTNETVSSLISGVSAAVSLSTSNLTGTTTFTVSTAENVHETVKYYAIKVNYDGTNLNGATLGATLDIAQSFAA